MNGSINLKPDEIGTAVYMMLKGWKQQGGGRGFWKRELRRLVSDPQENICAKLEAFPQQPIPGRYEDEHGVKRPAQPT